MSSATRWFDPGRRAISVVFTRGSRARLDYRGFLTGPLTVLLSLTGTELIRRSIGREALPIHATDEQLMDLA